MEVKWRVYILLLGNGQYYVWSTNDLERRIAQHKAWKVIATKGKLPLELLYTKVYETLSEARSALWADLFRDRRADATDDRNQTPWNSP